MLGVLVFENWHQRRWFRSLAQDFGMRVDLDPSNRLLRASPRAHGTIQGFPVRVLARPTGTRISAGNTRMRMELNNIIVDGPAHPYGDVAVVAPFWGAGTGEGFDRAFEVEGDGNGRLDELLTPELKERFRAMRSKHGRVGVYLEADGKVVTLADIPLTRRRKAKASAQVELAVAVARAASPAEPAGHPSART
jgi:hypothetical protein